MIFHSIFILLLSSSLASTSEPDLDLVPDDDPGQIHLTVEHSLDGGLTFSPRGVVTLASLKSSPPSDAFAQDAITDPEKNKLTSLCASDDLYLLKVKRSLSGSQKGASEFRAVADPCQVVKSGFKVC